MEIIKKIWLAIVAIAAAVLFILFKKEQSRANDAEAKVMQADTQKKDAVMATQQAAIDTEIKQTTDVATAEKAKTPTKDEMEEALKKI